MKYCVHYHRNSPFKYFDELAEIEITYRREDTTLPAFLEKYVDKTIIITIDKVNEFIKNNDIDRLSNLYTKYKNFKLRFPFTEKDLIEAVQAAKLPFFFSNLVDSWDTFHGILAFHPTDVYIVNELGFSLRKIGEMAHEKNVQVRCFPNVAQSSWADTAAITQFFIRPEDVDLYSNYVDVMEFAGEEKNISIYYEIYAHDKKWFGKLNEIILNFNSDLDSRSVVPAFAYNRVKCGKKCVQGRPCHICERVEHLSATLADQGLLVHTSPITY